MRKSGDSFGLNNTGHAMGRNSTLEKQSLGNLP